MLIIGPAGQALRLRLQLRSNVSRLKEISVPDENPIEIAKGAMNVVSEMLKAAGEAMSRVLLNA